MINFFDKFNLDNKKILLIFIAFIVVSYLDYSFILSKQMDSISVIEPKIKKLKKDLSSLDNDLLKMEELKKKQAEVAQKGLSKSKRLVSEDQVSSLFKDISDIANKNDIKVGQMKPGKDVPVATAPKTNKPGAPVATSKLSTFTIDLELLCAYHNLGAFINDLENSDVLIMVQSLKIMPEGENYMRQKVNLQLKTYVKKIL
ncbi:MAG: type 4a pilus biogenesis protein PilO [Candidatus Omnitrophica bacterium]|nr:type 4a pilus biogenesis protein PilO [Candidatus Omnitrophota bacterium]